MGLFNRSFVSLMALAWCAALALGLYLVWEQGREIALSGSVINFNFDLTLASRAEQILATLVIAALALPALFLLAMEMVPHGGSVRTDRRRDEKYGALEARADALEEQLNEERKLRREAEKDVNRERDVLRDEARRNADAVRESSAQPATISEERRGEERRSPRRRSWHILPKRS